MAVQQNKTVTTIDKDLKPIYTRENARKRGWSEAEIERVFGKEKPRMVIKKKGA